MVPKRAGRPALIGPALFSSLCASLALCGCWLEQTDGVPEPLDPRYYASVEAEMGDPNQAYAQG